MRTEMVIRMQGGSDKGQQGARAMKVAAAVAGVESVALAGKDKSLLRVVGDGVDCNDLTTRLRRKVGRADLVELRTLHGAAGAGYYGSRASSGLARVDSGYGASSSYGGVSYPATTAGGYAPEYYYGDHQPASSYGYYPPAAAPTVVHHEYYPPSTDPNGCSIM
ncbi:uncharacterized protein C2845_PM11G09420 [Panicum miliaceum]|uniref:Uncharacterized protein n=1 Tax=Panicum miliaceum TaxID=4540 RepID=A0A3L6RMI9_PANMI|nr:uncharacterized protein C2845_PM11G09420 [Panicum miliaceum]